MEYTDFKKSLLYIFNHYYYHYVNLQDCNKNISVIYFCPAAAEQSLGVVTDSKGRYQVAVEKQVWMDSAATYVYVNGARYSTADGSLQLVKQMSGSGMDGLGSWKEITNEFKPKGHKIQMLASIRTFDDIPAILFKQVKSSLQVSCHLYKMLLSDSCL